MSRYRVAAEIAPAACLAVVPAPHALYMVGGGIDEHMVVGQYAGLEVARRGTLHAHAGAGQVGRADIGLRTVEHHNLEMHPRTQPPL